ncbi:MAG: methyltransferase family protein [Candidatus Asgardarchaeia archaeon]
MLGSILFTIGALFTIVGILEFRSFRKVSGVEVSNLITSGIYRWSRNPQFFGLYLSLLGMSILGRSWYAILLSTIAIIYCHYYIVKAEEPFLTKIFGDEYVLYKSKTPRYIGIPKKVRNNTKRNKLS